VSLPSVYLFSQAGRPQKAILATHMTVVPSWNFFSKPAHLFLHVLRFERLRRFGATAVVTAVQVDYLPSIDSSGRRFWRALVDFEGVHSRPSYLGRFARPLISAPIISQ
jgi:hypothetical protein